MKKALFFLLAVIFFSCGEKNTENPDAVRFEANGSVFYMLPVNDHLLLGETEVTIGLWQAVMGSNPAFYHDVDKPVESVTWVDCQAFITKLNAMTGENFRLPLEKEWEEAARGFIYAGSDDIDEVAWYYDNAGEKTHEVKGKKATAAGFFDLSGNVAEWCGDTLADGNHPYRGGGWYSMEKGCRVDRSNEYPATERHNYLGLRLALDR